MRLLLATILLTTTTSAQTPLHATGTTPDATTFSAYAVQGATVPPSPTTPTLVAQCSTQNGRTSFDLFLYPTGLTELTYEGPWKRTLDFPNPAPHANLTLTAVGYRTYKLGKRSFETLPSPSIHYHYLPPGMHSANLADFPSVFPWLRSLPTLRVSDGLTTTDFLTTPLLDALHADPACAALHL